MAKQRDKTGSKEGEEDALAILIKIKGPLRKAFEDCRDSFGVDDMPNTSVAITAIRLYLESKGYLRPKSSGNKGE